MGYLSSVWISIEQSVIVFGIVYVFLGFAVVIGHVQWSLLIIGGPTGALTTIGCMFNYLSDFTENWLKGVYVYQDDTRETISQSDH